MKSPVFSHFSNENIIEQSNQYITFGQKTNNGNMSAKVYSPYQGFELVELDIDASSYMPNFDEHKMILEINYCHKGRMECRMNDGCLQYIGAGDLFLNMVSNHSKNIEMPLGHYQGIAVMLDLEVAQSTIMALLPKLQINLFEMIRELFKQDDCLCLLLCARASIEHIFSGIYTVPDEAKISYIGLKIQELIIYLNYLDVDEEHKKKTYTSSQVDIIKQIHAQITKTPKKRFTINELSHQYCISPTTLKASFKGVYGLSIAAYMKSFRIKQGAAMLRETQKSIMEIAKEMGYESQSKFGAAFKDIMGMSPMGYRKKYQS